MRLKVLSLLLVVLLGTAVAACGDDDDPGSEAAAAPEATATPPNIDEIAAGISKNTKEKPEIVTPTGDPPPELVIRDIVKGKGPKAKAGEQLTMDYVLVSWSNGQQVDASWDRGQTIPFQLGAGKVIAGWDQGMLGMREGGRRLLVIPPDLGYGPQGSPPIGPNETLVFAVDLRRIG